jgi:dephospho-CoA kinase
MSAKRIPVIGIVGGIGSGKSALANALNQHLHTYRLDADAAGHRALELSAVKTEIRRDFGPDVFDAQGQVIRGELARRVFGSEPAQRAAKAQLEQITHPVIRQELQNELQQLRAAGACDVILLDAALLLEAGWSDECDAVLFVDVPREQRLQRVQARGWTEAELDRREASQLPLDEKRRRSDVCIDNSAELAAAAGAAAAWISRKFSLIPDRASPVQHP